MDINFHHVQDSAKKCPCSCVPVVGQQRGWYHRKERWKSRGSMSRMNQIMKFLKSYGGSKGVRVTRLEEPPLGNLTVTCHLEEVVSHHFAPWFAIVGKRSRVLKWCRHARKRRWCHQKERRKSWGPMSRMIQLMNLSHRLGAPTMKEGGSALSSRWDRKQEAGDRRQKTERNRQEIGDRRHETWDMRW